MSISALEKSPTLESRFWLLVDRRGPDECWPWNGSLTDKGYGRIKVSGKKFARAHRVSLEISLGRPLQSDEMACHHCDNPPCVNPAHLYAGSARDNALDFAIRRSQRRPPTIPHHSIRERNRLRSRKLSEEQVRSIRDRAARGERPSVLAREFQISRKSIYLLRAGRIYRDIAA